MFGVPDAEEKSSISLLRMMPVPGTNTIEPKAVFTVEVIAAALPWTSIVEVWAVPPFSAGAAAGQGGGEAIWRRSSSVCAAESKRLIGTSTKSGSPYD